MKLDGSSAIVTGGGSGLGAATAEALAAAGARVVVLDLNEAGAQAVAVRANDIANGAWVDSSDTAGVNLELTAAEVLPALS